MPAARSDWATPSFALGRIIYFGLAIDLVGAYTERVPPLNTEDEIRQQLGIPLEAGKVLILSQSSHLDWDWLLPFPVLLNNEPPTNTGYFGANNGSATQIFEAASEFLNPVQEPPSTYYYSICEIGFLRGFANNNPGAFAVLKQAGANLRIVGGGITSPDNLLPTGEAFIRNYLIGKLWVDANLQLPLRQAWLPDDFGQDSQLPVLLAAMGFQGVGFSRIPGAAPYTLTPVDGSPSVAAQLLRNGVDFIWQAADGSQVITHWMQGTYCQGDDIGERGSNPTYIEQFINNLIATNKPASPTPYIFVPVGCDFRLPQDLPAFAGIWNTQSPAPEVYVVAASFDHYIQLVSFHALNTLTTFNPVPYHTGCYPMRPLIKRQHHQATRALLAAEVFSTIVSAAGLGQTTAASRAAALDAIWDTLSPSTHHDYITGTALSPVYAGEQIPLVLEATKDSGDLLAETLAEVAIAVTTKPQPDEIAVVVFNPLGIANTSLVWVPPSASMATFGMPASWSVRDSAGNSVPTQTTADGGLLFPASVESLGYGSYYVSASGNTAPPNPVTVSPADKDPTGYTIANGLVAFTVAGSANWAITEVYDLNSATPALNILAGNANDLIFYDEGNAGTNYNFANEAGSAMTRLSSGLTKVAAVIEESGPLRARIVTKAVFIEPNTNTPFIYTREYVLHWNEPFIRIRTIGAAPFFPGDNAAGYSVVTQFPLSAPIGGITQGTTYHWSDLPQLRYWPEGPAFQPTHDFVIARDANSNVLGAIYHGWVNAWGQTSGDDLSPNTLLGCLLRNTTGTNFDWFAEGTPPPTGTDPGVHVLDYAFRVPTGLGTPASGLPLAESLQFQNPMRAIVPMPITSNKLPETFSLASVANSNGAQAFITVAKIGSAQPDAFIFRIYQPSNATPTLTMSLSGLAELLGVSSLNATPVTALEAPIQGAVGTLAQPSFDFRAAAALTTFAVTT